MSIAPLPDIYGALPVLDPRERFGLPRTFATAIEEVRVVCDAALDASGILPMMDSSPYDIGTCARFLGYPALAQLAQDGLIQAGVGITADEMTRRWVDLKILGDSSTAEANTSIDEIGEDLREYRIQALFRQVAVFIGLFGGCLVFIDNGTDPGFYDTPLVVDSPEFAQGSLRGFKVVEPVCVSPGRYNASDPTADDFYRPETWYVYGREIHASRFLYFSSGDLPILLRPAYNFFGVSSAQLALDYLSPFTESREAAARLLKKFSLTVLKTNMQGFLTGGSAGDIDRRIQFFVQNRNNDGILAIDQTQEDVVKLETPLSGVTDIVRQALELLAAVFRIPAVKYLGISPGGFNATGESDIRSFYDHIAGQQEKLLDKQLKKVIDILCLNRYGHTVDGLTPVWIPLGDDDEEKRATVKRSEAERDAIYLDRQVLSTDEVRERLASDEDSGYSLQTDGTWTPPDGEGDEITGELLPGTSFTDPDAGATSSQATPPDADKIIGIVERVISGSLTQAAARTLIRYIQPDIPDDVLNELFGAG